MNAKEMLGWITAALTVATFLVSNAINGGSNPQSPVDDFSPCPDGWDVTSVTDHVFLQTCTKNGWVVVLNTDGTPNYGLETTNPDAVPVEPDEVPGWE